MFTLAYDNPKLGSLESQSKNSFPKKLFKEGVKYRLQRPKSLEHDVFTHAYDNPKLEKVN